MKTHHYDIIIVGGGTVGLTLACGLAQHSSLSIAVLESQSHSPVWNATTYHHRVSAITQASQRIFKKLRIWNEIETKRVSAFKKIYVWDEGEKGQISFDCHDVSETELGFIVENNLIQSILELKVKEYPSVNFYSSIVLNKLLEHAKHIELVAQDAIFNAKLVVAADGAQSWVRQQANIRSVKKNYHQQAVVAMVDTSLPHQQIAQQVFLKTGPLAFLPLQEAHLSSIVWTLPVEEAERLVSMDSELFNGSLAQAFNYKLGNIKTRGERHSFPLSKQFVEQYVKPGIALIGDAAHVIHPLAGQGVNMGLLDAMSLLDVIIQAVNDGRDFSHYSVLRRFERWRKADNFTMEAMVEMIKNLFANDKNRIKSLRAQGMDIINSVTEIKKLLIQQAIGNRGDLPELAKQ